MSIAYYISPGPAAHEDRRSLAVAASRLMGAGERLGLDAILARARHVTGARMAAVTAIFDDYCDVIAANGFPTGLTKRSTSFCGHAILDAVPVFCIPDAAEDERFAGNPVVVDEPHLRFYAGVPLIDSDGHALGALCVFDPAPRAGLTGDQAIELVGLGAEIMARLERGVGGELIDAQRVQLD